MKITIFYSWQSDSPPQCNKNLIQDALASAINRIISDDQIELEPVIDRDTLNIPGSPAIAQSILEKIDRCSLFLGDITIINKGAGRATPNPNVLIELGYAYARIGWERVLCVMNEEYGEVKKLPFDLRHRRWPIRYRISDKADSAKIEDECQALSDELEHAIRMVIDSGILIKTINPKDKRIAIKFENILNNFRLTLLYFLKDNGLEDGVKIFLEDYQDEIGTLYPERKLVDSIITVFQSNNLQGQSNIQLGDKKLNWVENFIYTLNLMVQGCERILDRYADRDDNLIALIDEIQGRAEQLAFLLTTSFSRPELLHLYDEGVPDMHIDWFRYFLLTVLKSYRVVRLFHKTDN